LYHHHHHHHNLHHPHQPFSTFYYHQYIVDTNHQFAAEDAFLKYQLAGFFTVLAGIIAVWHVTNHIRHMHYAPVQKRVLAILWLVPIYGFTSWLSLVWPVWRREMSVIRDCYEAYAVYTFFAFLCEVLHYEQLTVGVKSALGLGNSDEGSSSLHGAGGADNAGNKGNEGAVALTPGVGAVRELSTAVVNATDTAAESSSGGSGGNRLGDVEAGEGKGLRARRRGSSSGTDIVTLGSGGGVRSGSCCSSSSDHGDSNKTSTPPTVRTKDGYTTIPTVGVPRNDTPEAERQPSSPFLSNSSASSAFSSPSTIRSGSYDSNYGSIQLSFGRNMRIGSRVAGSAGRTSVEMMGYFDDAIVDAIVSNAEAKVAEASEAADAAAAENRSSGNSGSTAIVTKQMALRQEQAREGHRYLRPPFYLPWLIDQHPLRRLARYTLFQCRLLTLQFVLLRPVLTLVPFLAKLSGYDYDGHPPAGTDGRLNFSSLQLYVTALMNLSVALAFYGLISFYHATDRALEWMDPWPKFLSIKGVVFMTFWQGLIIAICSAMGIVDEATAASAQDFLICIEMLLASIVHYYIFPHSEWQQDTETGQWLGRDGATGPGGRRRGKKRASQLIRLRDNFALDDFARDIRSFQLMRRDTSVDGISRGDVSSSFSNEQQKQHGQPKQELSERRRWHYEQRKPLKPQMRGGRGVVQHQLSPQSRKLTASASAVAPITTTPMLPQEVFF
jgi:hypothetical protein